VVGYGKTLEDALTNLLDQLKLGPQQLSKEQQTESLENSLAQKAAVTEKKSTPYVRQYDLRSNTTGRSNLIELAPLRHPTANPGVHATTTAALPNPQLPKRPISQPSNTARMTCSGRVSPIEEDIQHAADVASMFGFRYPNPLATHISIFKEPVLPQAREKEKGKEADTKSGGDEGKWETRDAQEQTRTMAKLFPTRQVSSPFFSFGSSRHEQTRQVAESLPARQTPLVLTESTATVPGRPGFPSDSSAFASSFNTPTPRSVKVEQSVVFPPFDAQKSLNAPIIQTAQALPSVDQYRSKVDNSPPASYRSSVPDCLARTMQDRLKRRSSGSPEGQEPQRKIKVEEIRHESPKRIKVEETSCLPESRGEAPASIAYSSERPFGSLL
jgi:hypothetical protein